MLMNELSRRTEAVTPKAQAERGLFIIWARARQLQDEILADLATRFRVQSVREVYWTHKFISANFQRFYSDLDLRGVYHRLNKGDGPFLAITVVDEAPAFDVRDTGRGRRQVLANFMDAKSLYREWSGGIGIHCGETAWETERDLCMLFGLEETASAQDSDTAWDGSIEKLHCDLAGAGGWQSAIELFGLLNRATRYLAINYIDDGLPGAAGQDVELDILTEDYYAAHTVLNSGRYPRVKPQHGGRVPVRLDDRVVSIGLRFPADNYFDEAWARRLLASRVLDPHGFYRPADEDTFWVLAYHALLHTRAPGAPLQERLLSMARAGGLADWERCLEEDWQAGRDRMLSLLASRGIACPEPLDRAVPIRRVNGHEPPGLRRAANDCARAIGAAGQEFSGRLQTAYWPLRDSLLLRAPWLNKVKHWRRMLK